MGNTWTPMTAEIVTKAHGVEARNMGTVLTHGQMGAGTLAHGMTVNSMDTARSPGSEGHLYG